MKKLIGFSLCFMVMIVLAGCGREPLDTRQYIIIEQLQQQDQTYEEIKKITNETDVETVQNILRDASWGESAIELSGNADYRLFYKFYDKNIQAKPVLYSFWEDEVNSQFHVMKGERMYTYIPKEETNALLKLFANEKSSTKQTKIIDEAEIVDQIELIIRNVKWEKAKVEMGREEDYRMNIAGESIRLWITPNGKQFELVKNWHHSKLNEKDSQTIFDILER